MKLLRVAVALACLLAGGAAVSASAYADVVGHVYVNDNTAGTNTIAAFNRLADGKLTPVPGSPFPAGGEGKGSGIGSQGALQESGNGRYLLAVDAGSSQVSVLRIWPDGKLSLVGSPISSGGEEPVSIAVSRDVVYVANAGSGASNYTGFRLDHDGDLHPLAGSTYSLPGESSPGDVLFDRGGKRLVGVRVGTSLIDSFEVDGDGRLHVAPGSPIEAQGKGPFGSEFRPTDPGQLFVSNAHNGGTETGTVSAFSASGDGALSSIGGSPFRDFQAAPCWVEISHDGRFLFAVNTASNSISRYEIADGGALELLGSTTFSETKAGAEDARLDPDGDTLWLVETGANVVGGFAVNHGSLAQLSSSPTPLPTGAAAFGIVVT